MIRTHKHTYAIKAVALPLAAMLAILAGWLSLESTSRAADLSKFNPGNIMSDAVMSNRGSMSVQQIQSFLDSKNPCNNTNIHMAEWYPHLQYSIKDGRFVCMARENFNGKSAAQLIWEVGQEFNINPQVLIVLLEKEQGLVSDTWPNHVQYRTATGYGCPDTAPCDSQYYGLENQLKQAAKLFRAVLNGGWSNYPVGQTYVQYHPNAACGGSIVNIKNRATSALYRYTPYQPNASALSAGYGTGDSCGAYGNRNFFALFSDWFGSTHIPDALEPLDLERFMEVNSSTRKHDLVTGLSFGDSLDIGTQLRFVDKIKLSTGWCLRTEYDVKNKNMRCIPMQFLKDIEYVKLSNPKVVAIAQDARKMNPRTAKPNPTNQDIHPTGMVVELQDQITVDGKKYYRTKRDSGANSDLAFSESRLASSSSLPFENPRLMQVKHDAPAIDPLTGGVVGHLSAGTWEKFNRKVLVSGTWYYQPERINSSRLFISASAIEHAYSFKPVGFRSVTIRSDDVKKISLNTLEPTTDPVLSYKQNIEISSFIEINGRTLLVTKRDASLGLLQGIDLEKLYAPIDNTGVAKTVHPVEKLDIMSMSGIHRLDRGYQISFLSKIMIDNKWYLRSQRDHSLNELTGISLDSILF